MHVVVFTHSLVSCWNHGNAHFLRGVATELQARGHTVAILEPRDGWSRANLVAEHGDGHVRAFAEGFPHLRSRLYDPERLDLGRVLDGADVVLVHEWNDPALVCRIGERRRHAGFRLLFHDTHHRSVTKPEEMERYDLSGYDGVLAYGRAIRDLYLERGWARAAWTWHEAADVRVFRPVLGRRRRGDLVWIGNWGDGERTEELRRFLLRPAKALRLSGSVFGVRYPARAQAEVAESGLVYRGWVANERAPLLFAEHGVTVHVPRRAYVERLSGIPTIRPFEALACGIPLVSAPWEDTEGLFRTGTDYLVARDGREMRRRLRDVLGDPELARSLVRHGLETIRTRHTCGHRVDELLAICEELGVDVTPEEAVA